MFSCGCVVDDWYSVESLTAQIWENCDGMKAKWQTQAIKSIGVIRTEREREYIHIYMPGEKVFLVEFCSQARISMREVKPSHPSPLPSHKISGIT